MKLTYKNELLLVELARNLAIFQKKKKIKENKRKKKKDIPKKKLLNVMHKTKKL